MNRSESGLRQQYAPLNRKYLRAVHDFEQPSENAETSSLSGTTKSTLTTGDIVLVHLTNSQGWADGTILNTGRRGWLPASYCRPYDHEYVRAFFHGLTKLWVFCNQETVAPPQRVKIKDDVKPLVQGVRQTLESVHCLSREDNLVKTVMPLQWTRKSLLSRLAALVKHSDKLAQQSSATMEEEAWNTAAAECLQKAFDVAIGLVTFMDAWNQHNDVADVALPPSPTDESELRTPTESHVMYELPSNEKPSSAPSPSPSQMSLAPSTMSAVSQMHDVTPDEAPREAPRETPPAINEPSNDQKIPVNRSTTPRPFQNHTGISARPSEADLQAADRAMMDLADQLNGPNTNRMASILLTNAQTEFFENIRSFLRLYTQSGPTDEIDMIVLRTLGSSSTLMSTVHRIRIHNPSPRQSFDESLKIFSQCLNNLSMSLPVPEETRDNQPSFINPASGAALVSVATICIRAAAQCVAVARRSIEEHGDFEVGNRVIPRSKQPSNVPTLHPESQHVSKAQDNDEPPIGLPAPPRPPEGDQTPPPPPPPPRPPSQRPIARLPQRSTSRPRTRPSSRQSSRPSSRTPSRQSSRTPSNTPPEHDDRRNTVIHAHSKAMSEVGSVLSEVDTLLPPYEAIDPASRFVTAEDHFALNQHEPLVDEKEALRGLHPVIPEEKEAVPVASSSIASTSEIIVGRSPSVLNGKEVVAPLRQSSIHEKEVIPTRSRSLLEEKELMPLPPLPNIEEEKEVVPTRSRSLLEAKEIVPSMTNGYVNEKQPFPRRTLDIIDEKEAIPAAPTGSDDEKEILQAVAYGGDDEKQVVVAAPTGSDDEKEALLAAPHGSDDEKEAALVAPTGSDDEKEAALIAPTGSDDEKEALPARPLGIVDEKEAVYERPLGMYEDKEAVPQSAISSALSSTPSTGSLTLSAVSDEKVVIPTRQAPIGVVDEKEIVPMERSDASAEKETVPMERLDEKEALLSRLDVIDEKEALVAVRRSVMEEKETVASSPYSDYQRGSMLSSHSSGSTGATSIGSAEYDGEKAYPSSGQTFASEIVIGDKQRLLGGSPRGLIEALVYQPSAATSKNEDAFFLTYKAYLRSSELADLLVSQCRALNARPEATSYQRKRILDLIRKWVVRYWDPIAGRLVKEKLEDLLADETVSMPPAARQRLLDAVRKAEIAHDADDAASILTRSSKASSINSMEARSGPMPEMTKTQITMLTGPTAATASVLDLSPLEVARQLTLMSSRLFCNIKPADLLSPDITKGKAGPPSISAMSRFSTDLTNFISQTMLYCDDIKRRPAILKHWIKVAQACQQLQNYDGLMAIMCSLNSSAITRLAKTWNTLSSKTTYEVDDLKEICSVARNFASLRKHMMAAKVPCLPFLGIFLTDLTFVDAGNPPFRVLPSTRDTGHEKQVINFDRYARTAAIVNTVRKFQIPFSLIEVPSLRNWLREETRKARIVDEAPGADGVAGAAKMFNQSLAVEPRLSEEEKRKAEETKAAEEKKKKDIANRLADMKLIGGMG